MVRVLRYPRLSALCCAGAFLTAAARDFCLGLELWGPANVLLTAALILLIAGLVLLSCRFLVDPTGVGVGFLLRVRRTAWEDLSAFGPLCCNSRRLYLYGLYKHHPDFLHMLHKAPRCGNWGFVVPVSRKLAAAVSACCPFEIDLYTGMQRRREKGLRPVWQQAAVTALTSCAAAVAALFTAIPLLLRASTMPSYPASVPPTLLAALLAYLALRMLYRAYVALSVCPRISKHGISAGFGLFLSWDEVRFAYVHRMARISGFFLLSQPPESLGKDGCPPVRCLSMPDTSTLVLAYLTYCPHASKAVEA